jgi:hypothetical protein
MAISSGPAILLASGRRRGTALALIAAAMAVPVAAMRLASPEPADPGDFLFLAILVLGAGSAVELAARIRPARAYAAGLGLGLAAILGQAWINLAVGVIGSEDNPANLVYAAVIGVALTGALVARLRPAGMARAMVVAAIGQALAFVAVLIGGGGFTGPITIFFCVIWLAAAWLFQRAARFQPDLSMTETQK